MCGDHLSGVNCSNVRGLGGAERTPKQLSYFHTLLSAQTLWSSVTAYLSFLIHNSRMSLCVPVLNI